MCLERPDLGSQALGMRETRSKEVSVIGKRSGQGIGNNEDGSKFYLRSKEEDRDLREQIVLFLVMFDFRCLERIEVDFEYRVPKKSK